MPKKNLVDTDQFLEDLMGYAEGSRDQSILNLLLIIKRALYNQNIVFDDGELKKLNDIVCQ